MALSFTYKMTFVFITAMVICYCNLMGHALSIAAEQNRYINPNNCVYDPVLAYLNPFSQAVFGSRFFHVLVTVLLGLGLDACILSIAFFYATRNQTATVIPCVLMFHIVRAIALNIVIFPEPINYVFTYPGLPSFTAAYDRTNDLYFSGHIGTATVFVLDSLFHKQYRLAAFLIVFWFYTLFSLLTLGVHYTNDIIIGLVASFLVTRFIHRQRYVVILSFLYTYCFLVLIFHSVVECRLFRRQEKDAGKLLAKGVEEEQMMGASRWHSQQS